MPDGTKLCSKCLAVKALAEFSPRGKGRRGHQAWCKACKNAHTRKYFADRVRARRGLPPDAPKMQGSRESRPEGHRYVHKQSGYVYVKATGHHRANRYGWTYEHIIVAEQKFGIAITRDFTVHHMNGDRADNRPENLDLRWGNHGKGSDVLPGLLRDPGMRRIARVILAQYDD